MNREDQRLLDPELRARVSHLTFEAKRVVEGLLSGLHRSPHRGASVVFAEHREYRPGDDLRLLDWRAYARSDRHTIKRFEQETQLRAHLVLDASGSMDYGADITKGDCAATLLGALGLVLLTQGDAVGVMRFADSLVGTLPARSRPAHLELVWNELGIPIAKEAPTDLARALHLVVERTGRRGLVAIASDFLDFSDEPLHAIEKLRGRGHDVWAFHVMHGDELELPVDEPTRFVGLEGEPPLDVDPSALRDGYQREVRAFLDLCQKRCLAAGAHYRLIRVGEPIEHVLFEMFAKRARQS